LEIRTRGKGFYPFTREVAAWLASQTSSAGTSSDGQQTGLLTLFIQHTSASLVIQENADPDVVLDMADFFERLVPENDPENDPEDGSENAPRYRHTLEGPDDMPSHIRAALTQVHLSIPVIAGRMALGIWQGIYVFEHRASPQRRSVILHLSV
jgi:secondary thiamine-phosphate synthase enzyme